ncbi:MAG: hypothetical protein ACTSQU_07540 [Promethearchaeota archaeon]
MSKRITLRTEILLDGLKFPESPRWHDDKLWFVDMEGYKVMMADLNGNTETILEISGRVSGLGWLLIINYWWFRWMIIAYYDLTLKELMWLQILTSSDQS